MSKIFKSYKMLLALCIMLSISNVAGAQDVTINLYTINDFHGALRAEMGKPGIAIVSGAMTQAMMQDPAGTILLAGGDMLSMSLDAQEFNGLPVVYAMNKMGIAAKAVGNHIFDYPWDIINKQATTASFPFLACNIVDKNTGEIAKPFKPYIMVSRKGVQVAIVGVVNKRVEQESNIAISSSVQIQDPAVAQKYIEEAKAQGAQVIVLLAHIGSEQAGGYAVKGEITEVLDKLTGVDAAVTAHTHLQVAGEHKGVPVVQAGAYGQAIGKISIVYSTDEKKVKSGKATVFPLTAGAWAKDTDMEAVMQPLFKQVDDKYNVVIANNVRYMNNYLEGKSQVGTYITDLLKQANSADVAIINGGSLRAPLQQGTVTMRHLLEMLPFNDNIVTMQVQGKDIVEVVKVGFAREDKRKVQFSGIKVWVDESLPPAQSVVDVTLSDGSKIQPDKYYKVVTNEFCANGGDGFIGFTRGKDKREHGPIRDFCAFAFRTMKTLNYQDDDRLVAATVKKAA